MLTTQIKKSLFASSIGAAIVLGLGAVLPAAANTNALQVAQVTSLEPQTISVTGKGRATVPAAKAVLKEGKFSPSPMGIIYAADSCEGAEDTARAKAIADARAQAVLLAAASDLTLGNLSAIAGGLDFNYYGSSEIACATNIDEILSYGSQAGYPNYYGLQASEIMVNFSVYATYTVE